MTRFPRLWRSPEAVIGLAILLTIAAVALLAPFIYPGDPHAIVARPLIAPLVDPAHPFGTDRLGRDLAAELAHGARASLLVGLGAMVGAIGLGAGIGTLAGFAGGVIDEVLMRITEAFQTVPGFLLSLALVSAMGPSLGAVVLAVTLSAWTGPARLTRAQVLSIRERDYVAAARVIGMHPLRIAFGEVLPNALPVVLSLTAVIVAGAILTEAALSFLGLGDPNRVTWGGMIAEGRAVLRSAPHLSIVPGLALVTTVLGVYLAGEGLTEANSGRKGQP